MKDGEGGRFNNNNYLETVKKAAQRIMGEYWVRNDFCDSVSEGRGAIAIKTRGGFKGI